MTTIILCNTQLSKDYTNTIDFENRSQQLEYFTQKVFNQQVISNTKVDAFRDSITIDNEYVDTLYFDYLIMQDIEGNLYCYFIDEIKQVTKKTTQLNLTIDVFQTYMFDYFLQECFVDRCHVPRWNTDGTPTDNTLDEGLEFGHTRIVSRETIKELSPNYIICSTTPIGILPSGGGSITPPGGGGGNVSNAQVSNDLIRMLKGYEGFGREPYNLGDGVTTYGYGVTLENEPDFYAKLGSPPTTEKLATEVLIELIQVRYAKLVKNQMELDGVDLSSVPINVFDAFVDLCYNTGRYNTPLYQKWLQNPYDDTIYTDWLTYITMPGSEFEEGLLNRRKAEADIFRNGIYEKRPINIKGTNEYVEGDGYMPGNDTTIQEKLLNSARTLIGKPYRFGGNYPPLGNSDGTDCSGLCQWAYNENGKKISRTTYTQIYEGMEISKDNVKIGDLVFTNFSSSTTPEHVFMYSGFIDGKHMCIEAPRTGLNIRERSFEFNDSTRIRRIL